MKRRLITVLALVIAIVFAMPAFSAITTPLVRINLTKTVVITQEELDEKTELYKQSYGDNIDQATVLLLIGEDITVTLHGLCKKLI